MMPSNSPHHGRTNNGTGHQIPVPRKFPRGLKPVADHIHSLGMKFGLCASSLFFIAWLPAAVLTCVLGHRYDIFLFNMRPRRRKPWLRV